jgi:hypothetical protein
LQAADKRPFRHQPGNRFRRLAAHVGDDQVGTLGAQVSFDVFQKLFRHGAHFRAGLQRLFVGDERRLRF